ncbi:cytochrome P450 3A30 [Clathrospora elynae]|uniref:Cytochrome P450 3A30 n=1 Tax=Clathrospora elynae TaxID=706981 RepID=A0A6A5SDA5_9PLEO|nr:cytochrome P450 3A30 [Clathrospora elynae]
MAVSDLPLGTTILTGLIAVLVYGLNKMIQQRRFYKDFPTPPHSFLWGHLNLMGEIMGFLPSARKYDMPGVFYLDLWPASCGQVVVTDPDVAMQMTVTRNFPKHEIESWFIDPPIGPGNIVTTNGPRWKYLHKIMRPMVAAKVMKFRSIVHKKVDSGEAFRLEELTQHLTFDIATLSDNIDLSEKRGLGIMYLILREHLDEMRQSKKQELDAKFLQDAITQVKTLLIAGTRTTSDTICFGAMLLSVHPEIIQRMREEHNRVFTPGTDATYELLTADPYKLKELTYTTNVIKEVLRFYPIGNIVREGVESITYQGREWPTKGLMICPVQMTVHMDPKIFPNQLKFDPDRYTREDFPHHAWRPFERGPRACLGQPLAIEELMITFLLITRDFDFTCANLKPNKTPRVGWTDLDLTFGDRAFQEFVFEANSRNGMLMTVKESNWSS